jgi:hypothetical protein
MVVERDLINIEEDVAPLFLLPLIRPLIVASVNDDCEENVTRIKGVYYHTWNTNNEKRSLRRMACVCRAVSCSRTPLGQCSKHSNTTKQVWIRVAVEQSGYLNIQLIAVWTFFQNRAKTVHSSALCLRTTGGLALDNNSVLVQLVQQENK